LITISTVNSLLTSPRIPFVPKSLFALINITLMS
jgi:hypothetical protein